MSRQDDIKKLIRANSRRLQVLKEQKAIQGVSVDPKIIIEIENIEVELEKLEAEFKKIEEGVPASLHINSTTSSGIHGKSRRAKLRARGDGPKLVGDDLRLKFIDLCNPGWRLTVLNLKNDDPHPQGQKKSDSFIEFLSSHRQHGSFDTLITKLLVGALEHSFVFAELVLDDTARYPDDIAIPNPSSIIFQKSGGSWRWGQRQKGNFVDFSNVITIFCIPLYAFEFCGQPLRDPFGPNTIRLTREKVETALTRLFGLALEAQGIQARAIFKFTEGAGGNELELIQAENTTLGKAKGNRKWTDEDEMKARQLYDKVNELKQKTTIQTACQRVGISKSTYYNYKQRFE